MRIVTVQLNLEIYQVVLIQFIFTRCEVTVNICTYDGCFLVEVSLCAPTVGCRHATRHSGPPNSLLYSLSVAHFPSFISFYFLTTGCKALIGIIENKKDMTQVSNSHWWGSLSFSPEFKNWYWDTWVEGQCSYHSSFENWDLRSSQITFMSNMTELVMHGFW